MNLEEFGPDAKDEMSPADYIKFLMDKYYEYRTLAADPTINDQAFKLYLDKASEYYTRAQEAMDEIEPDNTDHLSDEDKALPNISLADQENELNNDNNTNEMFTKQARQYDQWADDNDKLKANKAKTEKPKPIHQQIIDLVGGEDKFREIAKLKNPNNKLNTEEFNTLDKKDAELSDKDKAMIDKYEDDEKEQEDSEINKIDAKMYREDINVERWDKLAGLDK
jgi:hypothetical protein